jgi:hypothetical protein
LNGDNVSPPSNISTPGSEGFFTRLRTKSHSGTTVKEMPIDPTEDAWSSDTSDDDDLVELPDDDRGTLVEESVE